MEAFRHSYTVENNKLIIKLPSNFKATEVDVIVLPTTNEKDWYDDLTDEQEIAIERGRADIKAGRTTPHKEVQKEIRKLIESKKNA